MFSPIWFLLSPLWLNLDIPVALGSWAFACYLGWDQRSLCHFGPGSASAQSNDSVLWKCPSGLGVEGECVGEGEGDADGEVHGGAEQTSVPGWSRPLHPHHQQRNGVWLPLALQLHRVELLWPGHHDRHPGGERYGRNPWCYMMMIPILYYYYCLHCITLQHTITYCLWDYILFYIILQSWIILCSILFSDPMYHLFIITA